MATKVLLGIPAGRDGRIYPSTINGMAPSLDEGNVDVVLSSVSLLARNHNTPLVAALNAKRCFDYLAICHDDMLPQPGWLDVLIAEQRRLGCDVVSAVVPIKNDAGLTSTGIAKRDDPWAFIRRLTLAEVADLPDTFGTEHVCEPDEVMVVNTGLMLVSLVSGWFYEMTQAPIGTVGLGFHIDDRIRRTAQGWTMETVPEDWNFSMEVQKAGGSVYATKLVELNHVGMRMYPNNAVWGAAQDPEALHPRTILPVA